MALEQHFPVLQVVGYQNSGKTTLMECLIKEATKQGLKVATLKHHGHPGELMNELPLKDSIRHQRAGSTVTTVEGAGAIHIHITKQTWTLGKLIELYRFFEPDIILVEGYKKEHYPKVVMLRNEEDLPLLEELSTIICAISWKPLQIKGGAYPIFQLTESDLYVEYIIKKMSDEIGN